MKWIAAKSRYFSVTASRICCRPPHKSTNRSKRSNRWNHRWWYKRRIRNKGSGIWLDKVMRKHGRREPWPRITQVTIKNFRHQIPTNERIPAFSNKILSIYSRNNRLAVWSWQRKFQNSTSRKPLSKKKKCVEHKRHLVKKKSRKGSRPQTV